MISYVLSEKGHFDLMMVMTSNRKLCLTESICRGCSFNNAKHFLYIVEPWFQIAFKVHNVSGELLSFTVLARILMQLFPLVYMLICDASLVAVLDSLELLGRVFRKFNHQCQLLWFKEGANFPKHCTSTHNERIALHTARWKLLSSFSRWFLMTSNSAYI